MEHFTGIAEIKNEVQRNDDVRVRDCTNKVGCVIVAVKIYEKKLSGDILIFSRYGKEKWKLRPRFEAVFFPNCILTFDELRFLTSANFYTYSNHVFVVCWLVDLEHQFSNSRWNYCSLLQEKATKWETGADMDGLTTNGVLIMHPNGCFSDGNATPGIWREVSVCGAIYSLRASRSAAIKGSAVRITFFRLHKYFATVYSDGIRFHLNCVFFLRCRSKLWVMSFKMARWLISAELRYFGEQPKDWKSRPYVLEFYFRKQVLFESILISRCYFCHRRLRNTSKN